MRLNHHAELGDLLLLGRALKNEYALFVVLFLLPLWVEAQERELKDNHRIILPEFPKDTLFVRNDTILPTPPDELLLGHQMEHTIDSISPSVIDTFPNGEVRIDYTRIPPGVLMLLAQKYARKPKLRRDFQYLDAYFKRVTPSMQDPNVNISLGDIIHLFGGSRVSRKERTKQIILQSY